MTTFKLGDRVIVTIDGHDTEWTVRHVFVDRLIVECDQISMNLPHEMVRPAQMEEPTKFGAMVQTDDGPAVRRTSDQSFPVPWFVDGYLNAFRSFHWSSLRNPRPYTGGDDD